MLYGTGLTDADMAKPQVGISSVWFEGNTCNMHLLDARRARQARRRRRRHGRDAVQHDRRERRHLDGHRRDELLAAVARPHRAIRSRPSWPGSGTTRTSSIPGCDKNMPGCLIAMGRLNRPALMVYGGTIRAGHGAKQPEARRRSPRFRATVSSSPGAIDERQRQEIVHHSCPGAGACGGMYTANTMASAIEALGMSAAVQFVDARRRSAKLEECRQAGAAIRRLLELDLKPRDIMTRDAFENAMVLVTVLGGSTNAVLHLIAIARSVGVSLTHRRLPARSAIACRCSPISSRADRS